MAEGLTGAVRQAALSTADFNEAERHGKRLDEMGKRRSVGPRPPLVLGSLDIVEARRKHMENVQQQGKTAALHVLVQFPTMMPILTEKQERKMLEHAARFVNEYHGGDAVFAARLDRDEKGRHTVDVFAMPRHDFTYKDGRTQKRASVSKFSKQHAKRRFSELVDADEDLKDPTSPIVQGRALQAAWFEYLRDEVGLDWIQPPERKKTRSKDRLEPEEYALKKELAKLAEREKQLAQDAVVVSAGQRLRGVSDPALDRVVKERKLNTRSRGSER